MLCVSLSLSALRLAGEDGSLLRSNGFPCIRSNLRVPHNSRSLASRSCGRGFIKVNTTERGCRARSSFSALASSASNPFWCLVSLTASTTYPGKVYVSIYRICMHDTERMHVCPVRQVGEWSLKSRGGLFYFLDQNKGEMLSISHLYQPWLMSHTADISTRPTRFTAIRLRSNSQIYSYGRINRTNYKKGSMIWRRVRKTREDNSFPYDLHGLPQTDVGLVRDYPYSMLQGKSALSWKP